MPNNILIGDTTGFDLPMAEENENDLADEKNLARYSKSKEFKRVKKYCEDRISFYQSYLPNGADVGLDVQPTSEDWRVANRVIGEFKALMNLYETAKEAVEESVKNAR